MWSWWNDISSHCKCNKLHVIIFQLKFLKHFAYKWNTCLCLIIIYYMPHVWDLKSYSQAIEYCDQSHGMSTRQRLKYFIFSQQWTWEPLVSNSAVCDLPAICYSLHWFSKRQIESANSCTNKPWECSFPKAT